MMKNKIQRYKDYLINSINENVVFGERYELRGIDKLGDVYVPFIDVGDNNYNPFDLEEMVKLLIKTKNSRHYKEEEIFIVKVKTERISNNVINDIKIKFESEKYNL